MANIREEIINELLGRNQRAVEEIYMRYIKESPEIDVVDLDKCRDSYTLTREHVEGIIPPDTEITEVFKDKEDFYYISFYMEKGAPFTAANLLNCYKVVLINQREIDRLEYLVKENPEKLKQDDYQIWKLIFEKYGGDLAPLLKNVLEHEKGHFRRTLLEMVNESVLPYKPYDMFSVMKAYVTEEINVNTRYAPDLVEKEKVALSVIKNVEKRLKSKLKKKQILALNKLLKVPIDSKFTVLELMTKAKVKENELVNVINPYLQLGLSGTFVYPIPGLLNVDYSSPTFDNKFLPDIVRASFLKIVLALYRDDVIDKLKLREGFIYKKFRSFILEQ